MEILTETFGIQCWLLAPLGRRVPIRLCVGRTGVKMKTHGDAKGGDAQRCWHLGRTCEQTDRQTDAEKRTDSDKDANTQIENVLPENIGYRATKEDHGNRI